MYKIVRAGALFSDSDAIMEDIEGSTALENPAWRQWNKDARAGRRARYVQPERWIYCSGSVDSFVPDLFAKFGKSKGLIWAARHAPGTIKMSVEPIGYAPEADCLEPDEVQCTVRDYQRDAITAAESGDSGVIVAPCGAGKTTIGVALGATQPTNVLVLVPSLDLAKQWYDRIRQMAPSQDVHIRTSKNPLCKRWTICTLQSLDRLNWAERWDIGKRHGLILVDECHRIPARTFGAVLASLPSAQRIGLSATPTRHDRLTPWIHQALGETIYQITEDQLSGGVLLDPEVHRVNYSGEVSGDCYTQLINSVCRDEERNRMIAGLVEKDRSVLILSDRVGHCDELASLIPGAETMTGAMGKKKRTDIIERARSGALRIICATTVADEGLDIPRLDTVVLASPSKNMQKITQRIGRILRPHPEKKRPIVYDIVDSFGPFSNFARLRARLYKKKGWKIVRA
jgi:superfamily II DNA or RNA helicase